MPIVKLTDKAPAGLKQRASYQTRRLLADDQADLNRNEAEALIRAGWAEAVDADEPAKRGPGRPKKIENQSQPEPSTKPEVSKPKDQPYMTRPELLKIAEKRGVELPAGYVSREDLVKLLGEVLPEELAEAGGRGRRV